MNKAKIYFEARGTIYDIEQVYQNLKQYDCQLDETHYLENVVEDIEDEELYDFSICFEGEWNESEEDLLRLTHHAEGLYENTDLENVHCEVFCNREWYGGDEHEKFEVIPEKEM